jgi:hypothetical protein
MPWMRVGPFVRTVTVSAVVASILGAAAGPVFAKRLGIGDSVMLGAASQLRAHGIKVNATVSRQFSALPGLIRSLRRSGHLPGKVIVHLGNNGYIDTADCRAAVRAARHRHVYLVTLKVPRGWRKTNNRRLHRCAKASPRASIIDWFGHSVNHSSWFASDHYHLTTLGARRYAGFLSHQSR